MSYLSPDAARRAAAVLGVARIGLGAALVLSPRRTARLLRPGQSGEHAGQRLGATMLGVREVGLGAMVLLGVRDGYPSARVLRLNAACDAGDALASISVRHADRRRMALVSGIGAVAWLTLARAVR